MLTLARGRVVALSGGGQVFQGLVHKLREIGAVSTVIRALNRSIKVKREQSRKAKFSI